MRAALKILALGFALLVSLAVPAAHASVTVTLTAPTDGTVYPNAPASFTLTATASAGQGYSVTQVDFYAGTTLIGSSTVAPYSVTWSNVPAGTFSLTAQATATKNNGATQTATSTAASVRVNAAPSVDITAPAPNTLFNAPATTTVTASALDSDGTVAQVEFFANGISIGTATAAPFSVQWANVAAGSYSLTAVATDNDGAKTTSAAVPVLANAPPTVSITSPANNATFAPPASITISADASDSDGTISRVDFYDGSTLLGSATTAPYTFDWTNVGLGTYTLTAHAIDNNNAETVSAPVNVTVYAPASTLYFIEPDHLNTPRLVADATGTTVWRWDQAEPFGDSPANENPGGAGTFDLPLRLPGQYYDAESGLQYNYFRDYMPSSGRYVESDPIGVRGGLDTYAYVSANPMILEDPSGLVVVCRDFYKYNTQLQRVKVHDAVGQWVSHCKTIPETVGPGAPDPFNQGEENSAPGGFPADTVWVRKCGVFEWEETKKAVWAYRPVQVLMHYKHCEGNCPKESYDIGPIPDIAGSKSLPG